MRIAVSLIALLLATGAGVPQTVQVQPAPELANGAAPPGAVCRDRIQQVRSERGLPTLDRDASPEEPLLIAAVDKRIGGCSVMVMRDDTSDIRPLPAPQEHRMMRAK
jgi:hypothetical protein